MSAPAHTFVVPAYGASPYLATCLDALLAQSQACRVLVTTSTPNDLVADACRARGVALRVHGPNRGIGPDWNFALEAAGGGRVTLAHQDDVYAPSYASEMGALHRRHPRAGLSFSDGYEIDGKGHRRPLGRVLAMKRLLARTAFLGTDCLEHGARRRLLLGLGNAIACPAVTLDLDVLRGFRFREDLRTNMDWFAWVEASRRAPLCHSRRALVGHRVHGASETSRCIEDGSRRREDEMMFNAIWPAPAASLLSRLYRISYEAPPK